MTLEIERFEGAVMAVNSYLIHAPEGIVVVDGQLTVSDATALRDRITATGKPLVAMVVTHPHPDHYAGAKIVAGDSVPIYATAAVAEVIRRDDAEKDAIVGPMMGEEWPTTRRFPDHQGEDGSTLHLAGLDLTVEDAGPGESHADSRWKIGDDWFTGDLVCHDVHAYLADGHFQRWLESLDRLLSEIDGETRLHVGHGEPTDRGAVTGQRAYISAFVDAVTANSTLDPDERAAAVVETMDRLVDDDRLRFLMELSIEPVAERLSAATKQDLGS
ncbi:MAG: MBL fold metallo-hydrolase [Acidimicrobiia bacterium]|nr:MBL fold metallo-hydrolase [Acidimicrobiia bacterium]